VQSGWSLREVRKEGGRRVEVEGPLAPNLHGARSLFLLSVEILEEGSIRWRDESRWLSRMRGLEAKFQDLIACARAHGDKVSVGTLAMLDELCYRSHIEPGDLMDEIAKRDGLVKVRLDSGKTVLCFPDELQPAE